MTPATSNSRLTGFAVFTALCTLFLIALGGLVTSHEAGMAVPDWPNSYGYNMFFFPVSQWVGGIFYEHTHRLLASFVGLLTTLLALWLWARETRGRGRWTGIGAILIFMALLGIRKMPVYLLLAAAAPVAIAVSCWQIKKNPGALRWFGVVAFAAVILQGVLGGLRVVLLQDQFGIFHATLAQCFFVVVGTIALLTAKRWRNWTPQFRPDAHPLRFLYPATTMLILGQLILGATMRHQHAGLAISDFPLAYGKIWPALDSESVARYNQQRLESIDAKPVTAAQIILQLVHRAVAAAIFLLVLSSVWATRKRIPWNHPLTKLSAAWLCLLLAQIALGAATIWSNKSADIATAHVVVGALTLLTGTFLSLAALRIVPASCSKNILATNPSSANFIPSQSPAVNPNSR